MRLPAYAWLFAVVVTLTATQVFCQAVQLPTFSFTTVTTTVVVPDGGSASLGGISRASSGRNEFGTPMLDKLPMANRLFKNQSIGQDRSASNFRVTATIHDFDAMDEALLNTPTSSVTSSSPLRRLDEPPAAIVGRTLQPRSQNLAGSWVPKADREARQPAMKLEDEQVRRAEQQLTRAQEAEEYFERGQQAEAEGKRAAAKVFYQMAAKRSAGELKQQVLARLEVVTGAQTTRVAQSRP
jgi:hypothetical protein